jgi:hypothetical protein
MDSAVEERIEEKKAKRSPTDLPKKTKIILLVCAAALVIGAVVFGVLRSRYIASTARLLRTEGTVSLSGEDGSEKTLIENMRFRSGNALRTESRSLASIGLDATKIVTMNENSRAEFLKAGKKIQLHLTDGRLFFQVSRKLADDESFDIRTSTMVVGIRGTSGYVSVDEDGHERVYVTDGTVHIIGTNPVTGEVKEIDLNAGERVTVYLFNDKEKDSIMFFIEEVGGEERLPSLIPVALAEDGELMEKVCGETGWEPDRLQTLAEDYNGKGADEGVNVPVDTSGHEVMTGAVIVIADSAGRVYDGTPLTAPGYRVEGLGEGYTAEARLASSITDAGSVPNRIEDLVIRSAEGEEYNRYFLNVTVVDGTLTIRPLPVLISTGSAEKIYDGTPLTEDSCSVYACDESFISWLVTEETPGTDRGFVYADAEGNETMWVLTGKLQMVAVNPLTKESTSAEVSAGKAARIEMYGDREEGSIVFASEKISAEDLPDAVIRHIASDEALLAQITEEALFDAEALAARIEALEAADEEAAQEEEETPEAEDDFIQRLGVHGGAYFLIRVTSDAAQFKGAPLSDGEAKLILPARTELPTVRVTGSRTDAGESDNLCEIEWGELDKKNFKPEITYGTLKVDPLGVTITTADAEKTYDGKPLTAGKVTAEPALPREVKLTATGSRTDAGESDNTYRVDWNGVNGDNYILTDELGRLTVTPALITVMTGSATKRYDGEPLTNEEIELRGAPEGVTGKATGSRTNAGESPNSYELDWGTVNKDNYTVEEELGTLTVNPIYVTVTTGSGSKTYDGSPLTNGTATISGAPAGVTVTATGSQKNAGSSPNTYRINWGGVDSSNYAVTENLGTLTVKPKGVTVTTGSRSEVWNFAAPQPPLTYNSGTITGVIEPGASVTCTGSQTGPGSSPNTCVINWGSANPGNYSVTYNLGTLTYYFA